MSKYNFRNKIPFTVLGSKITLVQLQQHQKQAFFFYFFRFVKKDKIEIYGFMTILVTICLVTPRFKDHWDRERGGGTMYRYGSFFCYVFMGKMNEKIDFLYLGKLTVKKVPK